MTRLPDACICGLLGNGGTDDLRDFVVENLSARREVALTETNLIFQHRGPQSA